jgi:hypothetical protein
MTVKHGWARKRRREPEPQHAEDAEPEASSAAAVAGPPASPDARHRSRAMKIITPLVLFGLGVVLLVLAIVLYPSAATEVPGPAVPWLGIQSNVAIAEITYTAIRVSSNRTTIDITMYRDPLGPRSVSRGVYVNLSPDLPHGMSQRATFGHSQSKAAVHFTLNAADSGMSFNGTTAAVAIPRIVYLGPGTPALIVQYPIPSASSYDWSSSLPTVKVTSSSAAWTTATVKAAVGVQAQASAPGQVVVGINHARQATDNNKTFIAGALLGLAGGAILSGVQEALHARD